MEVATAVWIYPGSSSEQLLTGNDYRRCRKILPGSRFQPGHWLQFQ